MVYPYEETRDPHWQRKVPNTHVQFVNTAKLLVNPLEYGNVESVTTNSPVAHGNLTQELLMQITES